MNNNYIILLKNTEKKKKSSVSSYSFKLVCTKFPLLSLFSVSIYHSKLNDSMQWELREAEDTLRIPTFSGDNEGHSQTQQTRPSLKGFILLVHFLNKVQFFVFIFQPIKPIHFWSRARSCSLSKISLLICVIMNNE